MILMTWAGFEFFVNPGSIRSFSDLRIETSSTFEDKEFNGLSYKEWKNADPYKVSCKAVLDIKLCQEDVRFTAIGLCDMARRRTSSGPLFYNGEPLLYDNWAFQLSKASIDQVDIAPNGMWTHAEISLEFVQSGSTDNQAILDRYGIPAGYVSGNGTTGTGGTTTGTDARSAYMAAKAGASYGTGNNNNNDDDDDKAWWDWYEEYSDKNFGGKPSDASSRYPYLYGPNGKYPSPSSSSDSGSSGSKKPASANSYTNEVTKKNNKSSSSPSTTNKVTYVGPKVSSR